MTTPQRQTSVKTASNGSPSRPDSDYTAAGVLRSEAMKTSHQEWADTVQTTSFCAFCDWTHEGTALEGREAARAHREKKHPEACIRRARPKGSRISKRKLRSAGEEEQIKIDAAEARRLRSEREQAEMLEKMERGRERDRAALAALDGEAA